MTEKEEYPNQQYRIPGNIRVRDETNLAIDDSSEGVLKEIIEATKESIEEFQHSIRNEIFEDGDWVKKTIRKTYYVTNEIGEIQLDEDGSPKTETIEKDIPPLMNEIGIAHWQAYLLTLVSTHMATSQYEKEEVVLDILDEEDLIADALYINEDEWEIEPEKTPILNSIIKNTLKACMKKAVGGKFRSDMAKQISHSEIANISEDRKDKWGDKVRKWLGG